jgi:hypothetical protein
LGKPLISDAAMRNMYAAMQQLRAAKSDRQHVGSRSRADRAALDSRPESLLAGLVWQLHPRDTLLTEGLDPLLETALESFFPGKELAPHRLICTGSGMECAGVAAGVAWKGAQSARSLQPVAVALLRGYPELDAVLELMAEHELAMIVVVRSAPAPRAAAHRSLRDARIPVLPVDESDAVAVCRVVQESLLRARQNLGGAVIHACSLPGAADALQGMEERLRGRGLTAN